jgi:hypothetical protein
MQQRGLKPAGVGGLGCRSVSIAHGTFKNHYRGFFGRSLALDLFGYLVAAAGASGRSTIRDNFFALMESNGLARPIDLIAQAVREMDEPVGTQMNDFGFAIIESGVVSADDGVPFSGLLQLRRTLHAAWHD